MSPSPWRQQHDPPGPHLGLGQCPRDRGMGWQAHDPPPRHPRRRLVMVHRARPHGSHMGGGRVIRALAVLAIVVVVYAALFVIAPDGPPPITAQVRS
jgi:hypothetical protein